MTKSGSIPVFVVSLPRFAERYAYITQHATRHFGSDFEVIGVYGMDADPALSAAEPPLTPGQVGCALSHVTIYRQIVERGLSCALVIEDDVILPENIHTVLAEARALLGDGEVIQFYNWSHDGAEFSKVGATPLAGGALYYPTAMKSLGTTAAYLISRGAAEGILRVNHPVRATADNWEFFFAEGGFVTGRALLPSPVRLQAFETTVLPGAARSPLRAFVSRLARLPILKALLEARRKAIVDGRGGDAVFTDAASALPPSDGKA